MHSALWPSLWMSSLHSREQRGVVSNKVSIQWQGAASLQALHGESTLAPFAIVWGSSSYSGLVVGVMRHLSLFCSQSGHVTPDRWQIALRARDIAIGDL